MMKSLYRLTTTVLVAGLFVVFPTAMEAQQASASSRDTVAEIRGVVRTAAHRQPVENVQIELVNLNRSTMTDEEGEFHFIEVPPGRHQMVVRHLGRDSGKVGFEVDPGQVGHLTIEVYRRVVEAEKLKVTVRSDEDRRGKLVGFYERKRDHPSGTFISPKEIENTGGTRLADVFRTHTFLRVRNCPGARSSDCFRLRNNRAAGTCSPTLYLDGALISPGDGQSLLLESTPKEWIAAVEVYRGAQAPLEYADPIGDCGVVLLWTHTGSTS